MKDTTVMVPLPRCKKSKNTYPDVLLCDLHPDSPRYQGCSSQEMANIVKSLSIAQSPRPQQTASTFRTPDVHQAVFAPVQRVPPIKG